MVWFQIYFFLNSYSNRFSPSQADVTVFEGLGSAPSAKFSHALRWYTHISSFGAEKSKFPGQKGSPIKTSAPAPAADDDDDDDVDLFGSDSEDVSTILSRLKFILT